MPEKGTQRMGEMILDGLKAMVLGMGMVYIFLVVMIGLMKLMSKLLEPYKDALVKQAPAAKKKAPAAKKAGELSAQDKVLAMAAIQAVKAHRGE